MKLIKEGFFADFFILFAFDFPPIQATPTSEKPRKVTEGEKRDESNYDELYDDNDVDDVSVAPWYADIVSIGGMWIKERRSETSHDE